MFCVVSLIEFVLFFVLLVESSSVLLKLIYVQPTIPRADSGNKETLNHFMK